MAGMLKCPWAWGSVLGIAATGLVGYWLGLKSAEHQLAKHGTESDSESEYSESDAGSVSDVESDSDAEDVPPGELKMVLCVRTDLGMNKGKVAAQCCHACLGAYRDAIHTRPTWVKAWLHRGQAKITLKVQSEELMNNVAAAAIEAGLPAYIVEDAGRTQIPAGSRTVLAIGPAPVAALDEITGRNGMFALSLM